MGSGSSNSGPCACKVRALPTEPSPRPCLCFLQGPYAYRKPQAANHLVVSRLIGFTLETSVALGGKIFDSATTQLLDLV